MNVVKYQTRIDASNIMEIIEGYDVIVDGVDNFPTRYLLNDATVRLKIPVVSASILGFDGQLSVFKPYDGPCYRCLFREPPPAELAPSCGANGVLGVLPGTMGLLQATEVVKLILEHRRARDRAPAALRRARRDAHRGQGPPRPRVPDLLARARGDLRRGDGRVPGLRGVLRRRGLATADGVRTLICRSHGHDQDPTGAARLRRRREGGRRVRRQRRRGAARPRRPATPRPRASCSRADGELNRYVNVYLNDEDVRVLDGLDTAVGEGDTLVILPAMAGGAV